MGVLPVLGVEPLDEVLEQVQEGLPAISSAGLIGLKPSIHVSNRERAITKEG